MPCSSFCHLSATYVSTKTNFFVHILRSIFPVHLLPYIPQHETRGVLIHVIYVMSCLIAFFFLYFFFTFLVLIFGLAFDPGTHGIQIGTEFFFGLGTHKVMALVCSNIGFGADAARCIVHRN